MQTYVAFMQPTSNLIDDSIERVILVDLIYSLLGVINHLICTQILHLSSASAVSYQDVAYNQAVIYILKC